MPDGVNKTKNQTVVKVFRWGGRIDATEVPVPKTVPVKTDPVKTDPVKTKVVETKILLPTESETKRDLAKVEGGGKPANKTQPVNKIHLPGSAGCRQCMQ